MQLFLFHLISLLLMVCDSLLLFLFSFSSLSFSSLPLSLLIFFVYFFFILLFFFFSFQELVPINLEIHLFLQPLKAFFKRHLLKCFFLFFLFLSPFSLSHFSLTLLSFSSQYNQSKQRTSNTNNPIQ